MKKRSKTGSLVPQMESLLAVGLPRNRFAWRHYHTAARKTRLVWNSIEKLTVLFSNGSWFEIPPKCPEEMQTRRLGLFDNDDPFICSFKCRIFENVAAKWTFCVQHFFPPKNSNHCFVLLSSFPFPHSLFHFPFPFLRYCDFGASRLIKKPAFYIIEEKTLLSHVKSRFEVTRSIMRISLSRI